MRSFEIYSFGASVVLFAIFFANVVVGASAGEPPLSNVVEMLALFAASALFVVGILLREAQNQDQ